MLGISPIHPLQLASVRLADTPTGKHNRLIGPSGTTRLGTGIIDHRHFSAHDAHWDWVKPT
jgi:hypothetical protein